MQNRFKLVVYYQFIFMHFPRCNTMLLVIAYVSKIACTVTCKLLLLTGARFDR